MRVAVLDEFRGDQQLLTEMARNLDRHAVAGRRLSLAGRADDVDDIAQARAQGGTDTGFEQGPAKDRLDGILSRNEEGPVLAIEFADKG